jgi:biopolymer transport protein ExbB
MDATAYNNHSKEFTGKLGTPAPIGRGITLKGEGERLVIGKSPSLNISKGFTFSAWVRMAGSQKDARLFSWDDGKQALIIGVDGTKLYATMKDGKGKASSAKAVDLPTQKWVHVAVTAEPDKNLTIYTDGRERTSQKLAGGLPEPGADISIGASLQGKNSFAGDIDEIQLAGAPRSQSYVLASTTAQGPDTPFLSYLEEESSSGGGEGNLTIHLMVVTMRAVTLDGWIIIGMLVVMGAWGWIVFFNKFMYLRKMTKSNAAFSETFIHADDFRSLKDRDDEFEDSSLFRVYRAGLKELESRVSKMMAAGGKHLPVQAITAFKASLDRASLQEGKSSTGGLLILTLSIAGGPFMGLLGTVWGVINTFAGVAEAGEASLAAIAPGVASALACTLAGLIVAIPALFAYSYLSAQIKNGMADMNVFLGEFITLVEEEYGGKHE